LEKGGGFGECKRVSGRVQGKDGCGSEKIRKVRFEREKEL